MKNYSSFDFATSNKAAHNNFYNDILDAFKNEEVADLANSLPKDSDGDIHLNQKAWFSAMQGAASGSKVNNLKFLFTFEGFVKNLKEAPLSNEGTRDLGHIWNAYFVNNKDFKDPKVIEFFKTLLEENFPLNDIVLSSNNLRVLGALTVLESHNLLQLLPNGGWSINGLSMESEEKVRSAKNNPKLKEKEKGKLLEFLTMNGKECSNGVPPLFLAIDCGNLNVLKWFTKRKSMWLTNFLEKSIAKHALEKLLERKTSTHRIKVVRTLSPHISWNEKVEKEEVIKFFIKNFIEKKALNSINHIFGYCMFSAAKFHLNGEFKYYVNSNYDVSIGSPVIEDEEGKVNMSGSLNSRFESVKRLEQASDLGGFLTKIKNKLKNGFSGDGTDVKVEGLLALHPDNLRAKVVDSSEIQLKTSEEKSFLNTRVDTRSLSQSSMSAYIKRKGAQLEEEMIGLFSDSNILNIIKNADIKKFLDLEAHAYRELKFNSQSKCTDIFMQWMFVLLCAKNVGYFKEESGTMFAQNCTDSEVKMFLDKVIPNLSSEVLAHPLKKINGLTLAHVCCILDDSATLSLLYKKDESLLCNGSGQEHVISVGACAVKAGSLSCLEFLMNNVKQDLIYKESDDLKSYREHLIHSLVESGLKLSSEDSSIFRDLIEQLVQKYPDIVMFRNQDGLDVIELMKEKIESLKLSAENSKSPNVLKEFKSLECWSEKVLSQIIGNKEEQCKVEVQGNKDEGRHNGSSISSSGYGVGAQDELATQSVEFEEKVKLNENEIRIRRRL